MPQELPDFFTRFLRWTEQYTKTDMVYLFSGGFWLTLGQIGAIAISFALAVAFGHFASQDAYGNYKYILTLATLLGALSLSGMGSAVTQSAAQGKDGVLRQAFRLNIRWSALLVFGALCAATYYGFAGNLFAAAGLVVVALFVPLINGFQLYDPYLVGKRDFRRDVIYNFLDALFPALLLVAALFVSHRAIVYVIVYFAATTVFVAFFYVRTLRLTRNSEEDPELLRYSTHLSVMSFVSTVADKIDSLAVFNFLGPASLGVYTYAIAMPEQIKNVLKNLSPLSIPKFTQRSMQEIRETLWRRILLLTATFTAGVVLYIILAPYLFRIFFPVYLAAVPYTQLYALSVIFTAPAAPIGAVLRAHKRTHELYMVSNISGAVLIVVLPILTALYGIVGAIISQILYRAVNAALSAFYVFRISD